MSGHEVLQAQSSGCDLGQRGCFSCIIINILTIIIAWDTYDGEAKKESVSILR